MKKHITTTAADRAYLRKVFNLKGDRTIHNACSFKDEENDLHKRIRRAALEHGAVISVTAPILETIHDTCGIMIQIFENGARIEADKRTGNVAIIYRGTLINVYENVKVSDLAAIQERAAAL